MDGYWTFETRYGPFSIFPREERFIVRFKDEVLGSYPTLATALDNLLGTSKNSCFRAARCDVWARSAF
jgi:hypothetical protein